MIANTLWNETRLNHAQEVAGVGIAYHTNND
jgi:hypothetical protein